MFHNEIESNGEDWDSGKDQGQEHEWEEYIDQGSRFADKDTGILNKEARENKQTICK